MQRAVALLFTLFTASAFADEWTYSEDVDKMTSKKESRAMLLSANSLSLAFPYGGRNTGAITVRQHPKSGLNVLVQVDKGQILCRSYEHCTVSVRFDEQKPVSWSAIGPSDGSSEVVFLRNESRFVAEAKKAKRILISLPFFRNGNQVLEFNASTPLQWRAAAKPRAK